ncbi:diadenylate cyclase CdaA [Thermosediminibacter litoriperuensis]|uniref:Diadenylate cyclase n=1 Tax=Thermosediminibacter litoriperuensis TaxID=291989 RepID=A0A5S5AYA8_9FIRM|nr:diadenylate cyclase CdaA [Thermosediminibacter litoriperuensis]TYP58857.1 diadenylate cyclase [Thermosediminibacter litoriperuensis]
MYLQLYELFKGFRLMDLLDIAIVAYVSFKAIQLIRGTRAVQLLRGLVVFVVFTKVSEWLGLYTINWLLKNAMTVGVIALLVVFQPELRRALEQLGRSRFFASPLLGLGEEELNWLIDNLAEAAEELSKNRIGALMVLERQTGLNEYIETGVKIGGYVTAELLINIFIPNTPLHDGAVIIRNDKIMAAGCYLPLTENPNLSKELGTRHRAALGVTEQSDAVAIIVSEETGVISVAREGKLTRYLDVKTLKNMLKEVYQLNEKKPNLLYWRRLNG